MSEWFYSFIWLVRAVTAPLYEVIYRTSFFFIDYWSLVHFINGFWIMLLFLHRRTRRRMVYFSAILLGWEIGERIFEYFALGVFRPEILPDQITDLFVGGLGGVAACYLVAWRSRIRIRYARAAERRDFADA